MLVALHELARSANQAVSWRRTPPRIPQEQPAALRLEAASGCGAAGPTAIAAKRYDAHRGRIETGAQQIAGRIDAQIAQEQEQQ